jgi:spermidine synthase
MSHEDGSPQRPRLGPSLYAGAIFAAAFLLFLVQPMVGKRILPWFGGAPAVWILCLAFYQTTLFGGYAYAHLLSRYVAAPRQPLPHVLVFAVALLSLPVLPDEAWQRDAIGPGASVLGTLVRSVALPFLFLAATGPLVQVWFARRYPGRSPYPLYAVSNVGSLLALLGYPLLLEPRAPLSVTGRLWSLAFAATGIAVLACAALARRAEPRADAPPQPALGAGASPPEPPRPVRVLLWLLLPACAVVLLMGVSNELCLDVASVPFLWILPLGVYLASFILCFGSERAYRRAPWVLLTAAPLAAQVALRLWDEAPSGGILALLDSIQLRVLVFCLLLLGACMVLHGELARLRPPARSLTAFYLCVSGGGALGGVFVGLVAPRLFDDYHELELGLGLGWLLLLAACSSDPRSWLRREAPRWRWAGALALTAILVGRWGAEVFARPENVLHQERTFFGVLRVLRISSGAGEQRQLYNGTTLHGLQFATAQRRPTMVFGVQTGIGLAMAQREPEVSTTVGVVGLGIGTLAAYGRPGDRFRFYELDPAVIRLARDEAYFTYLARSPAEIEIVEGDARLSLAAERARGAPRFDLLVIDAFTSVAIPVHLLTREAIALYVDSLQEKGLLAVHVSNRHFDLLPLLARLGDDAGLHALGIETARMTRYLSDVSTWVFLSRDEDRLRSLARLALERRRRLGMGRDAITLHRLSPDARAKSPLWTDDYSDLLSALRPLPLRLVVGRHG